MKIDFSVSFFENIGPDYLHRWRLIPEITINEIKYTPPFNVFLHKFLKSDNDRSLHDHPWKSWSILLKGHLVEIYKDGTLTITRRIPLFKPIFRTARHTHRLVLYSNTAWTIFSVGKKTREWGFWVNNRNNTKKIFVPWHQYLITYSSMPGNEKTDNG